MILYLIVIRWGGLAVAILTAVVLSHRHMLTILILFLVGWALFLFLWDPWWVSQDLHYIQKKQRSRVGFRAGFHAISLRPLTQNAPGFVLYFLSLRLNLTYLNLTLSTVFFFQIVGTKLMKKKLARWMSKPEAYMFKVTEKSCSGITLRSCSGHFQRPLNCCMVIFSGDKSNRAVR